MCSGVGSMCMCRSMRRCAARHASASALGELAASPGDTTEVNAGAAGAALGVDAAGAGEGVAEGGVGAWEAHAPSATNAREKRRCRMTAEGTPAAQVSVEPMLERWWCS